jgi:amidase
VNFSTHPSHSFVPYPAVSVANASIGPLAGLTFAVKDLFDVAGYPTGGGNPHLLAMSGTKSVTAPTVQRLLDAGAIFVGKTHTDELAFSTLGKNAHFGAPVNGADPRRITGGSSSGSASAVSHGLCDFALGTDTGGSVRVPASHCGLFGLRPTHRRISLARSLELCNSLDTCGFFAQRCDVFARVADVLLGRDSQPLPLEPRLLIAQDLFSMSTSPARDELLPVVAKMEKEFGNAARVTVANRSLVDIWWAFRYVHGWEAWQTYGGLIEQLGMQLGPDVAARFAFAKDVTVAEYEQGKMIRRDITAHLDALLSNDGVLLLPTMPDIAPFADANEEDLESYRNLAGQILCLASLSGFPQVTLPLGSRDGAPLGISLMGRPGSDRGLIAIAESMLGIPSKFQPWPL